MTVVASQEESRPTRLQTMSIGLVIFSFATDYRSENAGGDSYQLLLLGMAVLGALLSFLTLPTRRWPPAGTFWILTAMVVLIASSSIGAILNGVNFGTFIKLELRYILMFIAASVVTMWLKRGFSASTVVSMIVFAAATSIITNLGYTLIVRRESLETARYHIAPISATVLIGLTMFGAFKGRVSELIFFSLAAASIYFAATRTYALGMGVMMVWCSVLCLRHRAYRTLFTTAALVLCVAIFAVVLGGSELWEARFSYRANLADPTWQTRVAEYVTQWRLLNANEWTLLFGRGLGATYYWDLGQLRDMINLAIVREGDTFDKSEFGHSFWVYSLFSQGIVFGWLLPAILCLSLLSAFRGAWSKVGDVATRRVAVQVSLALLGCFVASFFAHQFGDRLYCVIFGALVTIAYWSAKKLGGASVAKSKAKSYPLWAENAVS